MTDEIVSITNLQKILVNFKLFQMYLLLLIVVKLSALLGQMVLESQQRSEFYLVQSNVPGVMLKYSKKMFGKTA